MELLKLFYIGLGGFCGAIARYLISYRLNPRCPGFPWGTILINITGSFALGLLAGLPGTSEGIMLFLGTGFMGAYTTFSTFSIEGLNLWQGSLQTKALTYLAASISFGIAAGYLGFALGKLY